MGAGLGNLFGGIMNGIGQGLAERASRQREMKDIAFKGALSSIAQLANNPNFAGDPTALQDLQNASFQIISDYTGHGEKVKGKGGKEHAQNPITHAQQLVGQIMNKVYPSGIPQNPEIDPIRKGPIRSAEEVTDLKQAEEKRKEEEKQQRQLQFDQIQAKIERQRQLEYEQQDYERWADRGKAQGLTGRDLAEYAATKGQKLPAQGAVGTPRMVYGKVKGTDGTQALFVNPRNPDGFIDADGNQYSKEQVELTTAPQADQRLYGRTLEISKYVEAQGYKKGSPQYDYYMGRLLQTDLATSLGRTQQLGAIDAAQSGIGLGQGLPSIPRNTETSQPAGTSGTTAPAPRTTAPASPRPSAISPAAPTGPSATPSGPGGSFVAPRPGEAGYVPSARAQQLGSQWTGEDRFVSMYLDSLYGNTNANSGAGKIGVQKGKEILAKQLGLNPLQMSAMASLNKNQAKALGETVQRERAVQRVNETLNEFGDELVKRAQGVIQTGSPLLNKPIRSIEAKSVGSPELRRFLIALNGFARQYSTLTSGGALSRAMLPVSVGEKVDKIIDPNATLKEVIETVEQVKVEGKREQNAFKAAERDILTDLTSGSNADTVKPQTELPAGSGKLLDANMARKFLDAAGGDKDKARQLAKEKGWRLQ